LTTPVSAKTSSRSREELSLRAHEMARATISAALVAQAGHDLVLRLSQDRG